ncbi:MAG: succinate dehydrogenase [Bacteroidetes bacterium]|nr:succinate dehydrogenase [Bacteroidota bacterium]
MNLLIVRMSSIAMKIWMSLLGLFLMVFLLIHLSINLCLLRANPTWFNDAAYFMGTNYVIKVFEVVLFGGFILHILIGIILQIYNWIARPVRYKATSKTYTPFLTKYMIYTGAVVLTFLVIHMFNFYFIKLDWVKSPIPALANGHPDFYTLAAWLFSKPLYSITYIILISGLGFHLYHAFRAALQSLGLNHTKYNCAIEIIGIIYSIVIPLGFIIIPIYFLI